MNRRARSLAVWALIPLIALAGCGQKPIAVRPPVPDAAGLAASISGRAAALSANGRIRAAGLTLSYAECRLLIDPAAGMRIDVFSPFLTPVASLVLTPGQAQFLDLQVGLLSSGTPADVMRRTLGIDVDPTPLTWILGGGIPPLKNGWKAVAPRKDEPPGAAVLESKDEQGFVFRVVFETERFCLTSFSRFPDDSPQSKRTVTIICSDHMDGKLPIPRKVELRSPDGDQSLILKMHDIEVGKGPSAEDLKIKAMPGIEEIRF